MPLEVTSQYPCALGVDAIPTTGSEVLSLRAPNFPASPGRIGINGRGLVRVSQLPKQEPGYWLVSPAGAVTGFGDAGKFGALSDKTSDPGRSGWRQPPTPAGTGSLLPKALCLPLVMLRRSGQWRAPTCRRQSSASTSTADGRGYWLVGADGGVFAFGVRRLFRLFRVFPPARHRSRRCPPHRTAPATGSRRRRNSPPLWKRTFQPSRDCCPTWVDGSGMASTPDGKGYWLVTNAGKVMTFGDVHGYGSMNTSQAQYRRCRYCRHARWAWLLARSPKWYRACLRACPVHQWGIDPTSGAEPSGSKEQFLLYTVGIATSYNYYSHKRHHFTSPTSTTAPVSTTQSPTSTTASPAGGGTTTGQPTTTVTAAPTTATTHATTTTQATTSTTHATTSTTHATTTTQATTSTTHATTTTQATTSTTHAMTSTTHATTTTQATTSTTHATTTTTAAPTTTTQPSTTTTQTTAPPAQQSGAAPASPPVTWCETGFNDPYTSAPAGAVTVPAGNNSNVNFALWNCLPVCVRHPYPWWCWSDRSRRR